MPSTPSENEPINSGSEADRNSNGTHNTDLFFEESAQNETGHKPWWKSQFFVVEPVLFGTWDGVFTSCLINIFGVVLFLRTGWMVGNVGIGLAMLIVVITVSVALLASMSAIGICERVKDVGTGGIYFLVSKVLGGKIGGTVGIMYAFGLCVVSALYCTGFAESITRTFNWDSAWAVRGVAIGTLILLLGINLAGVKWVIRLQLVLLFVLVMSTSDFIIGTLVHTDPANGFIGYSSALMFNNSYPLLQEGETFFTVFGVFFPTATGVMAGVNMSGDLKNPSKSIPIGTIAAIIISFFLYIIFVLLLGSTCTRTSLQQDFMIAEKVSAVGVIWLLGVYMSSTSSCSTGLYGAPRVLQCIANENVIPAIKFMGKGFGPNKTPVVAICSMGFISLLFIFIGNLNAISPVITCNFMLVYASVDYAYFALAMSYDLNIKNFSKFKEPKEDTKFERRSNGYSAHDKLPPGTMEEFNKDIDQLVKQKATKSGRDDEINETVEPPPPPKTGKDYLEQSFMLNSAKPTAKIEEEEEATDTEPAVISSSSSSSGEKDLVEEEQLTVDGAAEPLSNGTFPEEEPTQNTEDGSSDFCEVSEILRQPKSWYSPLCNRWTSLLGVFLSLTVMFLINWVYALANILAFLLIYLYSSLFNPGLNPGAAAQFNFVQWVKDGFGNCCSKKERLPEQMVVTYYPTPPYSYAPTQLTQDNEDFSNRNRFHQSAIGDYDYASLVADSRPLMLGDGE